MVIASLDKFDIINKIKNGTEHYIKILGRPLLIIKNCT